MVEKILHTGYTAVQGMLELHVANQVHGWMDTSNESE